jgi:ATP-dependent DNA helicase HFM1/MER3
VPVNEISQGEQSSDVPSLQMQQTLIWKDLPRIAKGLVDLSLEKKDGLTCKSALEMLRCVTTKSWEQGPSVLKQLNGIGDKFAQTLSSKGVTSIEDIAKLTTGRIEMLLGRNPPFGTKVRDQARSFPVFSLELTIVKEDVSAEGIRVAVDVSVSMQTDPKPHYPNKSSATALILTSDNAFVHFQRIPLNTLLYATKTYRVSVVLVKPSQKIVGFVSCERFGAMLG